MGTADEMGPEDHPRRTVTNEELETMNEELQSTNEELHTINKLRDRTEALDQVNAPVGYLVTDKHGVIREANERAADLLATESAILVGKPLAVFVPLGARRAFREDLLRVAESAATYRMRTRFVARDGTRLVVDLTVAPRTTEESDALRWVLHDATEQASLEHREHRLASEYETQVLERTARLESERALLEAIIQHIPSGVVVLGASGSAVLANAEALRILRSDSLEGSVFRAWREIEAYHLDGRRVERHEWPMARTLVTGETVAGERYEVVVADRRLVLEISTAPVLGPSGEQSGGIAVLSDVTIREQTERAERDFVTNAAHELQSPLAAIVSAIEVLQAGAKDEPHRDVFLAHIERGAERLTRLVRALLVLARTQIGVEAPRDELVALCPLLEEVGSSLRLSSSIELELDCPEDLAVVTNRELLEQAVANLAENAVKQTTTGRIVLSGRELPDDMVELAVSDTGSGIAPADRPRVFERFYRADANGLPGFGLGLAIVRTVADALDGQLELDSTVGRGTTIRLRIPRAASLVNR
jgi:two-component system, OmpR family, phosphate regulon sensor histidine kinase PhoR